MGLQRSKTKASCCRASPEPTMVALLGPSQGPDLPYHPECPLLSWTL